MDGGLGAQQSGHRTNDDERASNECPERDERPHLAVARRGQGRIERCQSGVGGEDGVVCENESGDETGGRSQAADHVTEPSRPTSRAN
jgi:hypothetical protein